MQIIEVEGFQKRVVYNACKAYATQLGVRENYPQLNDVIAVTLCDFELWPQRQEDGGPHRVPMLSRWRMQEQQALELARTANLTEQEWTEYEREKMAEQDFRGGLSLAEQRGEQRGLQRGQLLATAQAILTV